MNGDFSSDFNRLKSKSTMKVYVLGDNSSSTAQTIDGFDAFKSYIKDDGSYSKESPGAPTSYKLRYIRDNSIGKIVFAASYPIVTTMPRTDNIVYDIDTYLYKFDAILGDAGDYAKLYGNIWSWPNSLGFDAKHKH